ncbi:uncharacterized protein V1510DRAFT_430636 [Dipodascopsis tothii]|uniref:uncharacterized protein n=1 Tax=Dipodascopsis tothii TaxID=44089 RepID=UPI0034CDFD8B
MVSRALLTRGAVVPRAVVRGSAGTRVAGKRFAGGHHHHEEEAKPETIFTAMNGIYASIFTLGVIFYNAASKNFSQETTIAADDAVNEHAAVDSAITKSQYEAIDDVVALKLRRDAPATTDTFILRGGSPFMRGSGTSYDVSAVSAFRKDKLVETVGGEH